jgi:hypothetical protein
MDDKGRIEKPPMPKGLLESLSERERVSFLLKPVIATIDL